MIESTHRERRAYSSMEQADPREEMGVRRIVPLTRQSAHGRTPTPINGVEEAFTDAIRTYSRTGHTPSPCTVVEPWFTRTPVSVYIEKSKLFEKSIATKITEFKSKPNWSEALVLASNIMDLCEKLSKLAGSLDTEQGAKAHGLNQILFLGVKQHLKKRIPFIEEEFLAQLKKDLSTSTVRFQWYSKGIDESRKNLQKLVEFTGYQQDEQFLQAFSQCLLQIPKVEE